MQLVGELISSYGLEVVQAYMMHIQSNAELAVRDMLKVCFILINQLLYSILINR